MQFARWVFGASGVYGIILTAPLYFLEDKMGVDYPPPISHPEFYYGFAGAVLALQLMYLLIATDPVRYRPVMLLAIAAKGIFAISIAVLAYHGRAPGLMLLLAMVDAALGVLFVVAWLRTPAAAPHLE